ncbi:MAG TPA: 5-(carboxyamino)imidazole ribonucleotide mutase [Gammaproteobacteria bacterium]|jgi:5-(carboxyamino)imidazole ribonucleotide mutase|uniref:Phosphoribosylaminoimidazole carboxylase catalytic subunit n=1 Tax=hydrothermal vent metagenome TaxID=652676 RepID=A0A1W1DLN1_9ZZZZ|nr:5-(carboxyamino)imidazole ribonucleotide mutase [Gammaproteobacteria bacterium]HAE05059.1 5-(carboxyamino)imidazole ribonucleotide mutase [Gammaproteobacteria bacterium]HAE70648.1 5-(carboxyamino)imidazole ribonucleotide mutase [Gammaproteobacteria bacterium]HAE72693.1 5-(carboxyamino)imidazole ribonucleotide mutase [Gammaproteobacteria bacterium]HAG48050.1 5-(carboxyamino)imidazole ribonucleotide mutase [Gammaproteobacteria bacterium]
MTTLVGVIMGSKSDWPTMKHAVEMLEEFGVPHEVEVVSAHRTPDKMFDYASSAQTRGLKVIIAGAGGAAHLPGMVAAKTIVPVLGVPIQSKALSGQDSLLSIAQMPGGIPVGTLAIGDAGAKNAGILAAQIVANEDETIREKVAAFRAKQTQDVLDNPNPQD